MPIKETFRQKCQRLADEICDGDIDFFEDSAQEPVYDDGVLHVTYRGLRACFGLNEDATARAQNDKSRAILKALGMEKKITDRVLLDEREDDSRWGE